ncbi:MAG: PilZ domain-containing protein [Crocosphaera sp.]|nr:PilZ domain-containing protein [Crocosphaera sp.]
MIYPSSLLECTLGNKRKNHRFFLSKGTLVLLTLETEENLLEESLEAMIIDDSADGCGLIIIKDNPLVFEQLLLLKPGHICSMKIDNQAPILGEIVWFKELDDLIIRLGMRYLCN